MDEVHKDLIEVGERGSSFHIETELLFKVSSKADLNGGKRKRRRRGGGGRAGEGGEGGGGGVVEGGGGGGGSGTPVTASSTGGITFRRKSQMSCPICLRSSTRLRALEREDSQ